MIDSKILQNKTCQPRRFYSTKLFFRREGGTRASLGRQELREFTVAGPAVQERLEGALLPEMKRQNYTKL